MLRGADLATKRVSCQKVPTENRRLARSCLLIINKQSNNFAIFAVQQRFGAALELRATDIQLLYDYDQDRFGNV